MRGLKVYPFVREGGCPPSEQLAGLPHESLQYTTALTVCPTPHVFYCRSCFGCSKACVRLAAAAALAAVTAVVL